MSPASVEVMNYRRQVLTPNGKAIKSLTTMTVLVVKEGPKFLHAVAIDKTVKVVALPKRDRAYMRPLMRKGHAYEVDRACRRFLAAGTSLGITKSASAVLRAIRAQIKGDES